MAELTGPGGRFAMREVVVSGRPVRAWVNAPATLRDVVASSAAHGDALFLVSPGERWTFDRHYRAVCALARHLTETLGVRRGDRVAIAMRNWPEWSVAFWATVAAGAVAVPLNGWWTSRELGYALDDCGAAVAVVDAERLARLAASAPRGLRSVLVARLDQDACEAGFPAVAHALDPILAVASDNPPPSLPPARVADDDLATIFYTSGTSGRPKGVAGTHRNMCTNLLSRDFWRAYHTNAAGAAPAAGRAVSLLTVPLFHVTGSHSYLLPALAGGSTLVLMDRWDAREALRLVAEERVTSVGGVPTTVSQLLDAYEATPRDLSSLGAISVGGAPAPPALFERIHKLLPTVAVGNGYGMTETSSAAIYNFGPDCDSHPGSIGRLIPVMDARVVAADGADARPGQEGELWLRGPSIVPGYWRGPDTAPGGATDHGWLATGDLVTCDDDGFYTLVGRKGDVIIRGGENISPSEIEAALHTHPAVLDAGAAGTPHPDLGEEPVAFVQLRHDDPTTAAELRAHVRDRLAHFKVPVRVHLTRDPLPRNPQGKLLRRRLVEQEGKEPA
ncbi:MAG TPA: class I adenylate-forming enzyme family protein [Amycolatopsis sp.]|nr:class I adenylate-forming enzyme family protein [Amycolatopsis sp.]